MTISITKTPFHINCPTHGTSQLVRLDKSDAHGFSTVIEVCSGCLDVVIDGYQGNTCADCGTAVDKGTGLEKDGTLTPCCRKCVAARISQEG